MSSPSLVVQSMPYWEVQLKIWYLSPKGDAFDHGDSWFVTDPKELPDLTALRRRIRQLYQQAQRLASAPGERDAVAVLQERGGGGLADARARSGDDCAFHGDPPVDELTTARQPAMRPSSANWVRYVAVRSPACGFSASGRRPASCSRRPRFTRASSRSGASAITRR